MLQLLVSWSLIAVLALALPGQNAAQQLAQRISRAPDGTIRLTFATRAEVCGDGTFIGEDTPRGFRMYSFRENGYGTEILEDVQPECRTGPLRLLVTKSGNQVSELNAAVGVSWRTKSTATDLGVVPAAEAAAWLLDVALATSGERIQQVAFVAANAADSAKIADRLFRMAGNRSLAVETRARSVRWLPEAARREGRSNDADQLLRGLIRDETDARNVRERAIREMDPTPASMNFLKETYRTIAEPTLKDRIIRVVGASRNEPDAAWVRGIVVDRREHSDLRERALRTYGEDLHHSGEIRTLYRTLDESQLKERALRLVSEAGDSSSIGWLRGIARDSREPIEARDRAVRVMADAGGAESNPWLQSLADDGTLPIVLRDRAVRVLAERGQVASLKESYRRLDEPELKDRILRSVAERNGADALDWLGAIVTNAGEKEQLRDRALRLLSERGMPTTELAALYEKVQTPFLRQRLVRILAERGDDTAVAKLITIADRDPDPELRRLALRRLSETGNPKASAFLESRVVR